MTALVPADATLASYERDPFVIRRGARAFRGWTGMSCSMGIEMAARSLQLKIVGLFQDSDEQIVCGDPVSAWVGADCIFSGYAETADDDSGPDSESFDMTARSKPCDVVDSTAAARTFTNIRLDRLIAALCADFNVEVTFADTTLAAKIVRRFKATNGDKVFGCIDKLAQEHGFLVTDTASGALLVTRAGAEGLSTTRLVRGRNVLASRGTWTMSERFSTYEVRGQSFADDEVDVAAVGGADDPGVSRFRRLSIVPEKGLDRAAARERARWEAVSRAGKSVSYTATVFGWRQEDGTLWRPNQIVRVTDRRKRLLDAQLLVSAVDLTLDNSGRHARLYCAPLAGFVPFVPAQPILSDAGRWFGAVEGTTRPDEADFLRMEGP